ncbi:MAG: hypothetical protein UY48_C0042G0012 [Candidatus Gottesmanbacteria bacterium GW2011_GWB1_49_7]|uniref:Uncharacterized protein n=1 Tax=Candidatus Gottesmanbacteria bacterium GW2011_GWB1_49_7 TaxID=1618448 RepID=A0A0G1VVE7_9BACT|nr:MAG: hypothetical protein UY48_C0042G0012 [Candidatus Gottesmanbacteria bacterium GW2011_GWB1_49_7]
MGRIIYYFALATLVGVLSEYLTTRVHIETKNWDKDETYLGLVVYQYNQHSTKLKRQTFIGWGYDDRSPFSILPQFYGIANKRTGWRFSLAGLIIETHKR